MKKTSNKELYRQYSLGDFDKFDCLKLSKTFYISLIFILRGYIIWLMSVVNMKDRVATLQWVYPETSLFYLSLLSGSFGIFVLIVVTFRRPDAAPWLKKCWPHSRALIIIALLTDLVINTAAFYFWQMQTLTWLLFHLSTVSFLIALLFQSQRLKINLQEFPEKVIET